jgi:hypothetical protein
MVDIRPIPKRRASAVTAQRAPNEGLGGLSLRDEEIRAVVKPPEPGPHAINNAAQAAMLVESDREAV